MQKLFHHAGRAWSFITAQMPGADYIAHKTEDVTKFLQESERKLAHKGVLKTSIKDIEGCFPNMPKDAIKEGLKGIVTELSKTKQYDAVYVPKMQRDKCLWQSKNKAYIRMPFETLIEIMEFALDNTLVISLDGKLKRQLKGIPM